MTKDLTYTKREPAGSTVAEKIRDAVARAGVRPAIECPGDCALLLDISGSMWCGVQGAKQTRIEILRELAGKFSGKVRRFEYSAGIRELRPGERVSDPESDNNEPLAFETLKARGVGKVVLITDGGADDPAAALRAARGLKIDVIYVGTGEPPEFLRDLTRATGGKFDKGDFALFAQLESKVRALIAAPEDGRKGPILL